MIRHSTQTVQSRCERSIEDIVTRAGRSLTALDVYRVLLEMESAVSLSNVRRCLLKLHTNGRIQRVKLPPTGRCIYKPRTVSDEQTSDPSFVPLQFQVCSVIERGGAAKFPV
jgi:Fe2+ or Zn2+ uptake regulation protein